MSLTEDQIIAVAEEVKSALNDAGDDGLEKTQVQRIVEERVETVVTDKEFRLILKNAGGASYQGKYYNLNRIRDIKSPKPGRKPGIKKQVTEKSSFRKTDVFTGQYKVTLEREGLTITANKEKIKVIRVTIEEEV